MEDEQGCLHKIVTVMVDFATELMHENVDFSFTFGGQMKDFHQLELFHPFEHYKLQAHLYSELVINM